MDIFFALVLKLIPLYIFIGLGYIAGKVLKINNESVSTLLIYILSPAVIFYGIINADLNAASLSLPFVFALLCSGIAIIFFQIGKKLYPKDASKNILAFACGNGNSGYFGFPLVIALNGNMSLGIAVLCSLGFLIYENTLGFFLVARGNHSIKESLSKLSRLPTIYAALLGVFFNFVNIPLGEVGTNLFESIKSSYTVFGMMMIGLGLSTVRLTTIDFKFIATSFVAKFAVWPIIVGLFIVADKTVLHFYNPAIYQVMLIMSIVPLAANTVAFATKLNVHPEKAAMAVMLSTVFALIYIPIMISLLGVNL